MRTDLSLPRLVSKDPSVDKLLEMRGIVYLETITAVMLPSVATSKKQGVNLSSVSTCASASSLALRYCRILNQFSSVLVTCIHYCTSTRDSDALALN